MPASDEDLDEMVDTETGELHEVGQIDDVTGSDEEEGSLSEIADGEEEAPPQPRFATVELFVREFVLPNWVHRYTAKDVRWCDRWWEHAEAITRFEALWEAFEVMRLDPPPSLSTWLRDHLDAHMRTLTDPEGVFYNCDFKEKVHRPEVAWPVTAAPEGMFAAIEPAQIQRARAAPSSEDGSDGGSGAASTNGMKNPAHPAQAAVAVAGGHITKHTTSGVSR